MASASEISSFSSPARSRPNRMPTACPAPIRRVQIAQRLVRPEDALHLPALAAPWSRGRS